MPTGSCNFCCLPALMHQVCCALDVVALGKIADLSSPSKELKLSSTLTLKKRQKKIEVKMDVRPAEDISGKDPPRRHRKAFLEKRPHFLLDYQHYWLRPKPAKLQIIVAGELVQDRLRPMNLGMTECVTSISIHICGGGSFVYLRPSWHQMW